MSKKINKFFSKKSEDISGFENSAFGKYFKDKASELSAIGVDNSFKLDMLKSAEIDKNQNSIEKLSSFDYFSNKNPKDNSTGYDTIKWKNLYYKIRSQARSKQHGSILAEKYSNDYDEIEKQSFLKWFKFYSNGEHKRYAGEKMKLRKKGSYNTGLVPNSNYQKNPSFNSEDENLSDDPIFRAKENLRQKNKLNDSESFLSKINLANDEGVEYEEEPALAFSEEDSHNSLKFKNSISRGVRSILNNMMNTKSLPVPTVKRVMDLLNDLTIEAHQVKTSNTASSLIYKTANKLRRDGIEYGIEELEKLAQEVQAQPQPEGVAPEAANQPESQPQPEGVVPETQEEPASNDSGIPRSDEVKPVRFEDIETDGPEEGEYDGIVDDDINITDASEKLDQVAGMLADRRVIRNLAEFDIMLDKLGIASMFPELAESQSKLIDAFGYALTRVTKMMGQLSNAQSIMSSKKSVPGTDDTSEQ